MPQIGYEQTELIEIELPNIPSNLPYVVDDYTLAYSLGISNKLLWWLLIHPEQSYTILKIPKASGKGVRTLHAPSRFMTKVQTALLEKYLNPLQQALGTHVAAYRTGISIADSVKQHVFPCPVCDGKSPTGSKIQHDCPRRGTHLHIDLKDFFPSTRPAWIRQYFIALGYSHYVANLLASLLTVRLDKHPLSLIKKPTAPIATPNAVNTQEGNAENTEQVDPAEQTYVGVPQGFQGSGAICNLVADVRLDTPLLAYLEEVKTRYNTDVTYTRYSDDLEISLSVLLPQDQIRQMFCDIYAIIESAGFKVNKSKTRYHRKYQRRVILGAVVNEKVNCLRTKWNLFRAIVHNCATGNVEDQATRMGKTREEFVAWLRGNINWINTLNPQRGEKLLTQFRTALARDVESIPHD